MPRYAINAGSRELSTPHPHVPIWLQLVIKVIATLPGLLLVTVSVLFLFGVLHALVQNQQLMFQAVLAGLMLCFLWYLYSKLPHFLRRFISKLFSRSKRDDHEH
jgi:hypothetical protein